MRLSYGNGEYNGNIKSMSWQIDPGNSPLQQKYSFSYDGLSRLLSADYEERYQFPASDPAHNSGQFDVDLTYDLNGNIETLERSARGSATNFPLNPWETTYTSFTLDNLTYDYTGGGNQLQKVSDAATTNQTAAYAQFLDGNKSGDDYDYDANGNLTQDLNKGISSISYNHLNKPTVITYSNGNIIRYYYNAVGMKLRQTVYSADQFDPPQFAIRKRSDYLGAIHYEDADGDGTTEELEILFAQHEEGRYRPNGSDMIYEYNLTDHLGNTRITFGDSDADGDADILQESHYYPFGMLMTMTSSPSAAPPNDYLYNGKELQTELGLDWYDYGARMYDASIGRWNGVDALADDPLQIKLTPYNYTWGNPIKLNDPDGNCPFCLKGIIEGVIEFGTQLTVNYGMNGGDIGQALSDIDVADVMIAITAGALSPTPGSGKAAVNLRRGINIVSETTKAFTDITVDENGIKMETSELIGGEKSASATIVDGVVGIGSSAISSGIVDGSKATTSEALAPSNYAPLTNAGKETARAQDALVRTDAYETTVGASTGLVVEPLVELTKQKVEATPLNMGAAINGFYAPPDNVQIAPIVREIKP